MIVVDTNVLAYLLLPYDHSAWADSLFRRDPDGVAPVLWRSKFRNLLAGYIRRKTLTLEEAQTVQDEAEQLLAGKEHEIDSRQVLELVRGSDCSACDCEFIALAAKLGVKVATMDKKMLKAFPRYAMALAGD